MATARPARPARPALTDRARPATDAVVAVIARGGRIVDLPAADRTWFPSGQQRRRHDPGSRSDEPVRIPQPVANRLLRGLIRFVADIPAGTSLTVVWESGGDELWVDAGSIDLACAPGLLTLGLTVGCDQLDERVHVSVPFATGRAESPRGLMMSTFDRVDAPAAIAEGWSDAIAAFCWEALLELATRVSADVGDDRRGRPLIPGDIAAERGVVIVFPMARHDLGKLTDS